MFEILDKNFKQERNMPRGSRPQKVEEWMARLGRFGESGQTVTQFCKSERISQPSFYQWKKKLGRTVKRAEGSRPGTHRANERNGPAFRPVEVVPCSDRQPATIRFSAGVDIELGNDLQVVQAVVATVVKQVLDRQVIPAMGRSC
jgi:hypothetical protein